MLYIIGVGPGDPELITVKGLETLKKCKVVTGWGSVIDRFSSHLGGKIVIRLNYKEEAKLLDEVMTLATYEDVAFLNHGDPSVSDFQLVEKLKKLAEGKGVKIELVPGVSSVIRALHVIGKDLSQVIFITFHVRGPINYDEIVKLLKTGRDLLINPEPYPDGVKRIALKLKEIGYNCKITVLEKLSYPDEKIHTLSIEDIISQDMKFSDLSIVYIPNCSFS